MSAYVILTAVQERIIGSAFDDETIRERDTPKSLKAENNPSSLYRNPHRLNRFKRFTGFSSFVNIIYSKTPRRFPMMMRRTTPVEPAEPV